MLIFCKLVDGTQISTSPKATRHHNSTKSLILLPLRAIYFYSLHYETPCRSVVNSTAYYIHTVEFIELE